jgi:FXSXX-COOH protein
VAAHRIVYGVHVSFGEGGEGGRVDDTSMGSDLADLTDVMLDDLRDDDSTPLAHSIRRIVEESKDGHHTVVAGHETHI